MSRILIGGASGLIGSHLAASFSKDGHAVTRLVRQGSQGVPWHPERGEVDRDALERVNPEIVVNLAGATIGQRWSAEHKRSIRESRVHGTRALAQAIGRLTAKPRVFISGSAIGYYGAHRGDELLDESSSAGSDFLAQTAREWEDATRAASDAGIRVVMPRMGLVLAASGGALARMLLPFRLGVGGRIGAGENWMSWITLEDAVRALRFFATSDQVRAAVNTVAPEPVRGAEFASVLGQVLHRPTLFPVPEFALRVAFGEMADNTILASQRVSPKKLAGAGFEFRHPRLVEALRAALTQ